MGIGLSGILSGTMNLLSDRSPHVEVRKVQRVRKAVLAQADLDVEQLQRDIGLHSQRFHEHPNSFLQRAVQDAHRFTWYTTDGHPGCHQTHRGSRPGIPLADIAHNLAMMGVLKDLQPLLAANSLLCAAAAVLPVFPPLVTWVDDLAIPIPTLHATDLDAQIVSVLGDVRRVMASCGLQLNMQPGKTELVCQYAGRHAVTCRHIDASLNIVAVSVFHAGGDLLHVVGNYQHLGTAFSQSLSLSLSLYVVNWMVGLEKPLPHFGNSPSLCSTTNALHQR